MRHTVLFPGLGIGPLSIKNNFKFFGLTIHWYGILIALGLVLAYLFASKKAKKRGISQDTLLDVVLWGLPSAVVCARIYYVVFSWDSYKDNLLDVFKIWGGGIAIYGAIIGACISTLIYCHIKKISFKSVFDVGSFGLLIGQIVGRWGNFINAEAYGSRTETALFRMKLVEKGITVHPTFLYESFFNLLLFIFLNIYEKHQKFDGELFLVYITLYGLGRFFIEGMRADSLMWGPVRVSQILALLCVLIGLALIITGRIKHKNNIVNN
ncbi:MAG: prolipoprotein diacylglyceryl transferase [Clostridia bacterium]|nr:prolipoprotein diacylglyceryl transferase [Clostridia bacterium]